MDEKNKVRLKYYECNMTKGQHMLAYLFFSVMIGVSAVYLLSVYSGCGDRWIYNRDLAGEELFPDCEKTDARKN